MRTARVFVAIDLAWSVKQAVIAACRDVAGHAGMAGASVRWTAADQLHLTLHFLGSVTGIQVERLTEALGGERAQPSFQLQLGQGGVFPPRGAPRIIWLGVDGGEREVRELFDETAHVALAAGLRLESRPFHPHVTVGRVRRPPRAGRQGILAALAVPRAIPVWTVDRVRLYESQLSASGAVHRVLAEAELS